MVFGRALVTHFSPAYPEQDMDAFTMPIKVACEDKNIEYIGCFDCQGALAQPMHEPIQKMLKMSDEAWAGMVEQMTGHPNEEDVQTPKHVPRKFWAKFIDLN